MNFKFDKYQGAGNDFILIDNRADNFPKDNHSLVKDMCHRRFGIGADGLILLQNRAEFDFEMVYYNSDGTPSSMCGNGGRCILQFAKHLGIIQQDAKFLAVDGEHRGIILSDETVCLHLKNVNGFEEYSEAYILDTGSPHYVQFVENVATFDVVTEAKKIRYSDKFKTEGINVNFVERIGKNTLLVRTYERGVEDETLSCGTGVTAAALIAGFLDQKTMLDYSIKVLGGTLKITANCSESQFINVILHGDAEKVFSGIWKGDY